MAPIKIIKGGKPSNKKENGQKSELEGSTSAFPPGTEATNAPAPFIDKIAVVLTPKSAELAHQIHSALYQALTNDTEFFQSVGKPAKGFNRAKLIVLPHYDERPRIDYAFQHNLADRIRLEFNPSKLGADGIAELHGILGSVIPNGWGRFAKEAKITRLDIAVDILGLRMSKLQLVPKKGSTVKTWSQDGKLQTYQWGKPKGSHIQIYNKSAQQQSKGKASAGPPVTRFERRFKPPPCKSLLELAAMENPFAGIVLTTTMPAPPSEGPAYVWLLFCDSVAVRGLDLALKILPKAKRKAYRDQFKAAAPDWWNPEAIWSHWPTALAKLKIASTKW